MSARIRPTVQAEEAAPVCWRPVIATIRKLARQAVKQFGAGPPGRQRRYRPRDLVRLLDAGRGVIIGRGGVNIPIGSCLGWIDLQCLVVSDRTILHDAGTDYHFRQRRSSATHTHARQGNDQRQACANFLVLNHFHSFYQIEHIVMASGFSELPPRNCTLDNEQMAKQTIGRY
jgi:hypothetical protein